MYLSRDIENLIINLSKEYSCILIASPRQVEKRIAGFKPINIDKIYKKIC